MSLRSWSSTAASNVSVEGVDIGEGCSAANLNNMGRLIMADVASWRSLLEGAITSGGTANSQTLTSGMSIASYAVPLMLAFKAGVGLTNTTAATMAVDGLSAINIVRSDSSALVAGDIVAGGVYLLVYEATAQVFILINPVVSSSINALAALTPTTDNIIQSVAGAWASRTPTQVTATLIAMVGDSGSGGTKGLVAAPSAGDSGKYWKGDGTWGTPSGSGAPSDADYLVKTANGSLSAERVVTDSTSITWDWSTGGLVSAAVDWTGVKTLTNTTYNADGSGNSITNIENADIKALAAIDATKIGGGLVSNAEYGYLDGVTSAIQTQLDAKANLASPTFTGVPLSTTAAVDTNTTQIATTAYVIAQAASATPIIDGSAAAGSSTRYARGDHIHPTDTTRAPLASPTFTGTPAAPTAAGGTSTTQLATTAFVQGLLASPTFTGTPAAPTAALGTSTTQLATTAFANNQLFKAITSTAAGANNTTVQQWFIANGAVTVAASTSYFFEGILFIDTGAGVSARNMSLLFGGTATLTAIHYVAIVPNNSGVFDTTRSANITSIDVATAIQVITNGAAVAGEYVYVRGIVRINGAGTFTPQFQYSANPGAAPVVQIDTYFRLVPFGTNATVTQGTWA